MGLFENRPGFSLLDDKGNSRLQMSLFENGPDFRLADDKGTTRAVLGTTSLVTEKTGVTEGRPESSLVLFGPDGKVIETIP